MNKFNFIKPILERLRTESPELFKRIQLGAGIVGTFSIAILFVNNQIYSITPAIVKASELLLAGAIAVGFNSALPIKDEARIRKGSSK